MVNKRSFLTLIISLLFLVILSGCNLPWRAQIGIAITSHEEGDSVILTEETRIVSLATSSRGIESVELYVDGELEQTETPAEGNPTEFTADQPWVPQQEGNVVISVVATDTNGNTSEPFSLTLQVVPSVSENGETATPTATLTPEGFSETQTAQVGCTNDASFVQHVTIPINANLSAGSNFTKIWRINNNGTCDWSGYQLIHVSGDLLSASSPKALPVINQGENADIAVDMVAPAAPGTYSASWRIRAQDGTVFGPELLLTINVPQPPTDTPAPTATFTPTPTLTPTPTNTETMPSISVEQIFEQISIPASSNGNTTAACPSGSIVVGGGFAGSDGVRVYHSMKNDNGWRVYGRNTTGSSKLMNAYAICMHNSGGSTSQELTQMNIDPNGITNLKVNCPGGSVVTGGGWVIGSSNSVEIHNSSKSGNDWQIYVNNSAGDSPLINAYAICLSGVSGTTTQVSETSGEVPPSGTGHAEKLCPSGSYVTGGGFAVNTGAIIYNTSKEGNGWQNYARNTTGTQKSLYTYAICYSP